MLEAIIREWMQNEINRILISYKKHYDHSNLPPRHILHLQKQEEQVKLALLALENKITLEQTLLEFRVICQNIIAEVFEKDGNKKDDFKTWF